MSQEAAVAAHEAEVTEPAAEEEVGVRRCGQQDRRNGRQRKQPCA
jgi:hypothetical protein